MPRLRPLLCHAQCLRQQRRESYTNAESLTHTQSIAGMREYPYVFAWPWHAIGWPPLAFAGILINYQWTLYGIVSLRELASSPQRVQFIITLRLHRALCSAGMQRTIHTHTHTLTRTHVHTKRRRHRARSSAYSSSILPSHGNRLRNVAECQRRYY